MSDFPRNTIRASEIGQFVYCRRAWWLGSVEGRAPANVAELQAGTQSHSRHGRGVSLAMAARRAGLALIILGGLAMAAYVALRVMGG